jgi:tetratricopeptide (TPR) repeat protein
MGNFFGNIDHQSIESLRLTGVGWVFAFFIVGATILAGRWLLGLGLAKFNREIPGERDGKITSAGVAAAVMRQETKTLFDRADELLKQGTQSEDNRALIEAIDTYRRGLGLLARPESPLQWALAHTNLAVALETLGERENGTARIEEAVEVYREALKEYTREREPLDWAATQMNLGNALARLGERESGTARLEEAVATFRDVVNEYTRARAPLDWAAAQMNLGNTLRVLGEREGGTARLEEAVAAYSEALKEYTRARAARLGDDTNKSRRRARNAWRAGERHGAPRGGSRSLSRSLAGIDPRERAAGVGHDPKQSRHRA